MSTRRTEILKTLARFRGWIRRYILLEGLAISAAVACLLFWASFLLDWTYFQVRRLELPEWFRASAMIVMVMVLAGISLSWMLGRLFRNFRWKDLALVLERRFPELRDRLITAVQTEPADRASAQAAMLEQTTQEAAQRLAQLPIRESINPAPLRRIALIAGVLVVSVLALGLTNAQAMERWYHAYISRDNDYWDPFRQNALRLHVLAPPGDKPVEFDESNTYRHPRGADLQLVAESPEGRPAPDSVTLQFLTTSGGQTQRGRVTMGRSGEGDFRHVLGRVVDNQLLWIQGGDYVNRRPYRILVVEPPRVESLILDCDFPEYTGRRDTRVPVVGTQSSLPMETEFLLIGQVNKPLRQVHLHGSQFDLTFGFRDGGDPAGTRLIIAATDESPARTVELAIPAKDMLSEDRREFRIPCRVTSQSTTALANLQSGAYGPIPLPAEAALQLFLDDEDGIYSPEPAMLMVSGIPDEAPLVEARRTGIGGVITRMANIPIEGRLTDDYGVVDAWFNYRVDEAEADERRPLRHLPTGQKEFPLQQAPEAAFETFNLIPLELAEGQTLRLAVACEDGDNLNGPHVTQGELFTFRIVSQEELLARLMDREVNLRLRFEQARTEVADLKKSLQDTHEQILNARSADAPPAGLNQILQATADRSLNQIRKNQTESASIEVSFRDLRDEMVNNRVDTRELLERIERRVIDPLEKINTQAFADVDRELGIFRLTLEREGDTAQSLEEVQLRLETLLKQMDAVLAEMKERGTYSELIQQLQQLIEAQKKVLDETEQKRIEENFFSPID